MDRRILLTLIGSAGAALPAFAQNAATGGAAPAGPAGGPMGKAEADHAARTGMAGAASLKVADIGLEKASNARVKQFAQFEHDEQTTVAAILASMDPSLKPMPDPKMEPTIERLSKMKAGKAFDAFIEAQTEGHGQLLAIQEDYLKIGRDRETVNATKLVRGMVKEHLALLADLKKIA